MNTRRLFALTAFREHSRGLRSPRSSPSSRPGMADAATDPRDRRAHAGSAIDIVSRLVFEQVSKQIGQTIVIENRSGASQTLAAGCGRQSRSRRLHAPGGGIRARGRAVDDGEAPDQRADRSHRRRLARQCSAGDGGQPSQGLQDDPRFRRGRKGKAGHVHLRFGRTRRRHASCRGALPAGRRLPRALRAVPGRARSADRNHGGAARLLHVAQQRLRCR